MSHDLSSARTLVKRELPPYVISKNPRAKHARLRLSFEGDLTVVVPLGFDLSRVPELVDSQLDWVTRTKERLDLNRSAITKDQAPTRRVIPRAITFPAVRETWSLTAKDPDQASKVRELSGKRIVLSGPTDPPDMAFAALQRWLTRRARSTLEPWLMNLAAQRSVSIEAVSIRAQRSRWASCSPSGSISLNRALLFLDDYLVEHVLLHELCHLDQMNHSFRFWALLREADPNTDLALKELRTSRSLVPAWARPLPGPY